MHLLRATFLIRFSFSSWALNAEKRIFWAKNNTTKFIKWALKFQPVAKTPVGYRECLYHWGFGNGNGQSAGMPISLWHRHLRKREGNWAELTFSKTFGTVTWELKQRHFWFLSRSLPQMFSWIVSTSVKKLSNTNFREKSRHFWLKSVSQKTPLLKIPNNCSVRHQ